MKLIALLAAGESEPGQLSPGLGIVGGITLLERQVRMALKAGVDAVALVAPALPADLAARLAAEPRCWRLHDAGELAARLAADAAAGEESAILLFAPGLLIDARLVEAMVDAPPDAPTHAPLLLAFAGQPPAGAERLDSQRHWAGLARMPAALVCETARTLGDWELTGTLVRAAVEGGAGHFDVESLSTYAPARRRDAPMVWAVPEDDEARRAATDMLIDAAQKGCLDWPARFLHPPVENLLVRLLLTTPVTPNMVTILTAILGIAAMLLFATGQLWWGLALAIVVGPLDGVDGKLARARHEFSRWGDLEHVLDKIIEYGWFLALGYWFSISQGISAWLVVAGIIVFALTEAASGEFFRRFTGRQLDDWGAFERRFRLIGGRRNTFFWTLIPFGLAGQWWPGMLWLLFYAFITFAVSHWRLLKAIAGYGRDASPIIRGNLERSAYDFLPSRGGNAR